MPFFPVDDQAAFHPKFVAAGNAAIGLWARAGSWAKNHATGGFIPRDIAVAIGTKTEIKRLVTVGLWEEVLGGYLFHDWTQYGDNKSGAEEEERREAKRAADRERQRRYREKQTADPTGHGVSHGVTERDSHGVTSDVTLGPSPSPVPSMADQHTNSPVLETGDEPRTDHSEVFEAEYIQRAANLRVDFRKVRDRFAIQAEEPVPDEAVWRCIWIVTARAKNRDGDRTGVVLASLKRDWAEWSRLAFHQEASA